MVLVRCRLPLALLLGPTLVSCVPQNVTVDDAVVTGPTPQYLPDFGWVQGATCSGCGAHPDPKGAFNGTWHDGTFHPNDGVSRAIEFTFTGSAIYVFFILANTIKSVDTATNLNFILDSQPVGTFEHDPSASTDFEYNVPVYVNETIPLGQHNLRMEATGSRPVLFLFDYLIYTSDSGEETSVASSFLPKPTSAGSSLPLTTQSSFGPSTTLLSLTRSGIGGTASIEPSSTDETISAKSSAPLPTESSLGPLITGSRQHKLNIASIVGGTVAGVVAFLIMMSALLFYSKRRRSRESEIPRPGLFKPQDRRGERVGPSRSMDANVDKFGISSVDRPSSTHRRQPVVTRSGEEETEPNTAARNKMLRQGTTSSTTLASEPQQLHYTVDVQPSADTALLREQVELLMDEVTRLRHLQLQDANAFEMGSEAPPGYSEGRASVDSTH